MGKDVEIREDAPRSQGEAVFELNFMNGMIIRWFVSFDTAEILSGMCERAKKGETRSLEFGVNTAEDVVVIPGSMFEREEVYYREYDANWWRSQVR